MTATKTRTAGQEFADAARYYFSIGTRTPRRRKGDDLHAEITQAAQYAATLPGYFAERIQGPMAAGFASVLGWEKHIAGYRANGTVIAKVNAMTPWQFTAMLGDMIDAGVTNTYQAEQFFRAMREGAAA